MKVINIIRILPLCMLLAQGAHATELLRVKLKANLSYQDPDTAFTCSPSKMRDMVLSADIEGEEISYASLFPRYVSIFSPSFFFSREESFQIKLHRDTTGRLWLRKLSIEKEHLLWLLYNLSAVNTCRPTHEHQPTITGLDGQIIEPPYPLVSAEPALATFEFELEGIEEGVLRSHSNLLSFSGSRSDGSTYSGKLSLQQTPFE